METPLRRLRGPLAALAALLIAWVLLPSLPRLFVRESFAEFQAPALGVLSRTRDLVRHLELTGADADTLAAAGRDLARANAALELRVLALEAQAAENRRLRGMLASAPPAEFRTVVARVAAREASTWWTRLVIRRGREDGVRRGCPVVVGDRVVGRVAAVHLNTSEVELITSPGFRCAAMLDGDDQRRVVFVSGKPNPPFVAPRAAVTHIPREYFPPAGQPAVVRTTDLGGLYPAGLRLGTLEPILEEAPEGAWKGGKLAPSADLRNLAEVSVLVPTQPQPYEDLR